MKKNLRKIIFTILALTHIRQTKAQLFSIGQNAEQVKGLIEWETKDHYHFDTYGHQASSIWTSNVNYSNGKIIEVVQCCQNQYMYDLKREANYCKHFVMKNDKLSYVLTQFENISKERLIENFDKYYSSKKIKNYYFSENYENYSTIYLASNGLATIKLQRTVISELPINIQKAVDLKLTTIEAETKKKQKEELKLKTVQDDHFNTEKKEVIISQNGSGQGNSITISRGLQGRRISSTPSFTDEFHENAKVAVDIRVDASGNVTSAEYQAKGSTAADSTFKVIAIGKARQIKFNNGSDETAGTVVFKFGVENQ